jgi:NAD(P)-dependent dehydrogenase (short-subunit alcohol dehydrogenase family)
VADQIRQRGGKAVSRTCDVSNLAEVRRVVDAICAERTSIEILVNNAGIAHVGNVLNTEEADFERIFRVNVKGVYHCLKACVAKMVDSGGGVILNMASIVSLVGIPDRFAYSMSKGAVQTMTYSIAVDFLKHNIRCNCICPARIHTPFVDGFIRQNYPGREKEMMEKLSLQQPLGRMGTPEDVAALALYLCSDEASFVTGAVYPLDGGVIHLR